MEILSESDKEEIQSPLSESPQPQSALFKGGEEDGEISPSTPVYLGPAKVKKSNFQVLNTFKSKYPQMYQEAYELALSGEQHRLQTNNAQIHVQFKLKHNPGIQDASVTGNISQLGKGILSKAQKMQKGKTH